MNDHSPTPHAEVVARLREALEAGPTTGVWMRNARLNGPFWHISSDHTIGGEPCKSGLQAVASVHGESKRGAKAYAAMFEANADWIAAANPSAICTVLNALDSATAREAELTAKLSAAMEDAKALRNDAKQWREWLEAQRLIEDELPEDYRIILDCSPGDWSLRLTDPDGNNIEIGDFESTSNYIRQAVEEAKLRAGAVTVKAGEI